MPGDYSRETFDPRHPYAGVLMQQGRVQMDADWNEQQAIHQHRGETQARDIIGACGAPLQDGGFALELLDDGRDLRISPGRIYVDGILGALPAEEVRARVLPGNPGQLQLDSLVVDGYPLAAGAWIELRDVALPLAAPHLFQVSAADPAKAQLTLPTAVAGPGAALALRRVVTFLTQPDYPQPGIGSDPTPLTALPADRYLAYLDVWQREVTALEVPRLRETALGGPDTATRLKTVCQVRLLKLSDDLPADLDCTVPLPQWDDLTTPPSGRMNARTREAPPDQNPCQLPPTAGYRRLENQLYRVQIHQGGLRSAATFKWSRDNGSVETGVDRVDLTDGRKVWVTSTGPDEPLGFRPGDWVELLDATVELQGTPHPLARITAVSPEQNLITLDRDVGEHRGTVRQLRRWDQSTGDEVNDQGLIPLEAGGGDAANPRWVELEGGVEVHFEDAQATYRSGDYWLIPARTFSGDIEWPPFETPNRHPVPQPPRGIHHHYCRLALVDTRPATRKIQDCRCRFPALHQSQGLFAVSGDGQEIMPVPPLEAGKLARLPHPLVVGVLNPQGCPHPARVRFVIRKGTGRLCAQPESVAGLTEVVLKTDDSGRVECWWELGADLSSPQQRNANLPSQEVEAQWLDELQHPRGLPVRFQANLSVASQVAYVRPKHCAALAAQHTVQDALDRLAGAVSLHPFGPQHWQWPGRRQPREVTVQVLAANRCHPVKDMQVRFQVVDGQGSVTPVPAFTDPQGLAKAVWRLDGRPGLQVLQAVLEPRPDWPSPPPFALVEPTSVFFTALGPEAAMRVRRVVVGQSQNALRNDEEVALNTFAEGLRVFCQADPFQPGDELDPGGDLEAACVQHATAFVTVELPLLGSGGPLALLEASRRRWGEIALGFSQPVLPPTATGTSFQVLLENGRPGGTVAAAVLAEDGRTVFLSVPDLKPDTNYVVRVQNIAAVDTPNEMIQPPRALAAFHYSEAEMPRTFALLRATPTGVPDVVRLQFSRAVAAEAAQIPQAYEVEGGVAVLAATVTGDGSAVDLTFSPLEINRTYQVRAGRLRAQDPEQGELPPNRAIATFYVGDSGGPAGFQPVVLAARVGASRRVLYYEPLSGCRQWLLGTVAPLLARLPARRTLARLTLKGSYLWDAKDPELLLDGETFGRRGERGRTDLGLEAGSGDGLRGGDFEMWFWLTLPTAEPAVIVSPAEAAVIAGQGVTFTATVHNTPGPVACQWQMAPPGSAGFVDLPGAITAEYRLMATMKDHGARFRVVANTPRGTLTSNEARLTVTQRIPVVTWNPPAAITYGTALGDNQLNATSDTAGRFDYTPAPGTVLPAGTHTLTTVLRPNDPANNAEVTREVPLLVNRAALRIQADNQTRPFGTANPALTVRYTGFVREETARVLRAQPVLSTTATTESSPGDYPITVHGAEADNYAITHVDGMLTVTGGSPLQIVRQPDSQTRRVTEGVSFTVEVTGGTGPLSYQWRRGGGAIQGATAKTYEIGAVTLADNGSRYSVVVTDGVATVTSAEATLTVTGESPLQVTVRPEAAREPVRGSVIFTAEVSGATGAVTYQWQKQTTEIPGATSARLALRNLEPADSGPYRVRVASSGGSAISPAAILTVEPGRDPREEEGEPQGGGGLVRPRSGGTAPSVPRPRSPRSARPDRERRR